MSECKECNFEFVKKTKSNGGLMLQKQCQSCGQKDGISYKFAEAGGKYKVSLLPDFNQELEDKYYEMQMKKRMEERIEKRQEFFNEYSVYLKSDKWQRKRKKVLERDNYICKACETNKATEVHHTSYEFIYDEPLFDLVSVCNPCHEKIEELKRINKGLE